MLTYCTNKMRAVKGQQANNYNYNLKSRRNPNLPSSISQGSEAKRIQTRNISDQLTTWRKEKGDTVHGEDSGYVVGN